MQLGPETNDFQVEGANTSSDADIFSPNHKVTLLKSHITKILFQPILLYFILLYFIIISNKYPTQFTQPAYRIS